MDDYIREEMENQRQVALTRLTLAYPNCTDEFAVNLARAYFNELTSAITIAEELNLYPMDFNAILRDEADYEEEWIRDEQAKIGEWLYDNAQRD
jgi:hypothetical protein